MIPQGADCRYPSVTGSWPVRLDASDTVEIYGSGKYHGDSTQSMTYFTGFRIGAQS